MKRESDVRAWLKDVAGDRVFWIENKGGGTVGMGDALLAVGGKLVPLELKFDTFALRPAQRNVAQRMMDLGIQTYVLSGTADGRLWITTWTELLMKSGHIEPVTINAAEVKNWDDLERFVGG